MTTFQVICLSVVAVCGFSFFEAVVKAVSKHIAPDTELRAKYAALNAEHSALLIEWNKLVDLINSKGGMSFLRGRSNAPAPLALTDKDIKSMLMLCHPDKHAGSQLAAEITRKLIAMRK